MLAKGSPDRGLTVCKPQISPDPSRRRFPTAEVLPFIQQAEAGIAGQELKTVHQDDAFPIINPAAPHIEFLPSDLQSLAKGSPHGGIAIIKEDTDATLLRRHFPPNASSNLIQQVELQIATQIPTDLGPQEGAGPR